MAFKTLFKGREKKLLIRKELEQFKDLLKTDKKGKILPILTETAEKRVRNMHAIAAVISVIKRENKTEKEGYETLLSYHSYELAVNAIFGGIVGGSIGLILSDFIGAFPAIAVAVAIEIGMVYFMQKAENAEFVKQLKALGPKIRESMGKG